MSRTPVITLLAGLAVAGVLLVMSSIATTPPPSPIAAIKTPAPSPSVTPSVQKVNAVWAGEVDGGAATIAISVKDGVAVAYLCDGQKIEAWLQGTASDGKLVLSGKNATLEGTFGGGKATGQITAGGRKWTFTAPVAQPPGGLYRAAQEVSSATVVCGWIVLPDGRQVGLCSNAQPAPRLDTSTATPLDPRDMR
ncbi:hypothetical protein [Allorhizocola rhizosphaerae]|uniref:hypothetical protein n=1 Tax=Allorhizocola rhizosphaerae TaxID=1872709 RepID=UPI000E3D55E5|nr:hypothetical protein [Allorhizocola rhizosphaerae]